MIARSGLAKLLAFVAAVIGMVGVVALAFPEVTAKMAGGGQSADVQIGTAFADMAVGTLVPETVQTALQAQPVLAKPFRAEPARAESARAEPARAEPVRAEPVQAEALPAAPVLRSEAALKPSPSVPVEATVRALPSDALISQTQSSTAPSQSVRPKRKNPDLAARAETQQKRKRAAAAQARAKPEASGKTTRGNAQTNNRKGATDGTRARSKAKNAGQRSNTQKRAGNAKASNYPGQVMRKISRQPQPRVGSKGTAVIGFSISANGRLAAASVKRSSGSPALDRAALRLVRRAAPFPRPPAGAQRVFSIRISGR